MIEQKPKTAIGTTNYTWVGIILTFIFGYGLGLIAYFVIKSFDLKENILYVLFFFLPPISGLFIYLFTKSDSPVRSKIINAMK